MDKGNAKKEKKRKNKNRNREAVEFVLANRDVDDPNYNNPDANKKILLQVNKDEDLTEEQKKIINSIPKIQRGIFDEEAKLKRLLKKEEKEENDNNDNKDKKGVKFDFDKNEVVNFDKKKKVAEIENDKLLSDLKNNKIDLAKIEDEEKVNEIFKKLKVNAKMVEYNEFGLKKDTDPELLKFVTNKEFVEGVDIFVPAPRDNNDKIIKDYDTDMKEENMNEEFKELENELKSDSENENNNNDKEDKKDNEKKCEDINTSSKKEDKKEETKDKNDIEITGDLEDDFVLLANGGELPIELLTEKEIKEEEKKKEELNKINFMGQNNNKPSYKYITPEEVEYVRKKFLEGDDDKKKSQKKGNFISKQEFNDAVNEILNSKKGKNGNKKETVMGLKKSVLDEDEYEEYELTEEEEEINDDIKNKDNDKKEEEKKNENAKKNGNNEKKNKIKDIITFKKEKDNKKKEDEEEDDEDEEEEEDDEEGYVPNIKIEYVSKADEPDPFDKEKEKIKRKKRNKKEMKKSKTKQYEQLKAKGELSDESFDREQLDELVHEDELVEKTKEMIENNNEIEKDTKEVEQEIDKKYIYEPKVQKDITQTNDKVVNLPKAVKEERREKDRKNKKDEKEEDKEESKKEDNNQNMNVNHNSRRNETKEEKKLRQKLVKMEKKEKRAEKKKLKNAFKEEKISQQKQIAQTNKIVRYGLSIKDI